MKFWFFIYIYLLKYTINLYIIFNDVIYYKNNFKLALKFVENGDCLIEIETEENTKWNTIDKIIKIIDELELPIEKNNYFVKKAEIALNKLLKR